ncbi:MAG: ribonuclease E/G, partial [Pseudomonadota bacterium]
PFFALTILRELEEEGVRQRCKEMLLTAPIKVANYLLNQKRDHVMMIESRYGIAIRVEGDPMLVSPDHRLERFKTATRVVPAPTEGGAVQVDGLDMLDEAELDTAEVAAEAPPAEPGDANGDGTGKRKRKRRRRGRGKKRDDQVNGEAQEAADGSEDEAQTPEETPAETPSDAPEPTEATEPKPKSRRRSVRRKKPEEAEAPAAETTDDALGPVIDTEPAAAEAVEVPEADVQKPKTRRRTPRKTAAAPAATEATAEPAGKEPAAEEPAPQPAASEPVAADPEPVAVEAAPEPEVSMPPAEPEPVLEAAEVAPEPAEPPKPKKRGWWSRG